MRCRAGAHPTKSIRCCMVPALRRSVSRCGASGTREMVLRATLRDGVREGAVDDLGGVELLLDQAPAEIEIDRALLVRYYALVDRRDADFCARQPVQGHSGRDVHQLAPGLGITV